MYADKVVLVTGSRRGVGRLLTDHFLREDAIVVGFARGDATVEHDRYHHVQVDITDVEAIQKAFVSVRQTVPRVDILVNNAAVLTSQYSMIMAPNSAKQMVETNLLAPFFISRECAKIMRKNKWGRIVNVGSMAASLEPAGDSIYAACKSALATMGNVMAKEYASFNVTCNTVAITAIETEMLAQLPKDKIDEIIRQLPIPRYACADDITNVVDFFASPASSYITAQTVFLGGVN